MATAAQRLVTEARLSAMSPTYVATPASRRVLLTMGAVTVEAGDTKWRDITGSLANGWTAEYVHIRRSGQRTMLRTKNLNGSAATSAYFVTFPVGFFPGSRNLPYPSGGLVDMWIAPGANAASIPTGTKVSATPVTAELFVGDLPWPSSLPSSEVAE